MTDQTEREVIISVRGLAKSFGTHQIWESLSLDVYRGEILAIVGGSGQGKIERWHQTLKNRILLENYFLPGDLTASIEAFVTHYNHQRYHESLSNLTPADVYFGRGQTILLERERIKKKTLKTRRLQHRKAAA